ncbi:MAG TPA: hypothetical protein VL727_19315 [Puia sp.]|nr:hypothetical protein [Puia sp.]
MTNLPFLLSVLPGVTEYQLSLYANGITALLVKIHIIAGGGIAQPF